MHRANSPFEVDYGEEPYVLYGPNEDEDGPFDRIIRATVLGQGAHDEIGMMVPPKIIAHHAIVGIVKPSIREQISDVDVDELRRQHESFLRCLKDQNLRVIEVDLQGPYQTYLLLERAAVSVNGIVFLPMPRTVAEQNNTKTLKAILQAECSQMVVDQRNPQAKICGSDVLFTGLEIFVGITETTNEAGAKELASAFPDFAVSSFKLPDGCDHIKNYICVAGEGILTCAPGDDARKIFRKMMRRSCERYQYIPCEELLATNCLYVNHTLMTRAIEEIPKTFSVFIDKVPNNRRSICFTEFQKLSAGLSSVCFLTKKVI